MADTKGASILATLTAEVMAEKKGEARKLTPLAGDTLPNDTGMFMSNEVLHARSKQLREFAAEAIAIADGLDAMIGPGTIGEFVKADDPVDLDAARKEKEAAADSKFAADFAAKQEAAQAAVYTPDAPEGWTCPTHNKATEKTSPKTGKTYIGCPDCNLFKR